MKPNSTPPPVIPVNPPPEDPPSASLRMVAPFGVSGWAIAAGYLALFSVLLVFAPFALLTGVLALRDIARNPAKLGKGRAWFGIVMGTLGSIILVLFLKNMSMS